MYQVVIAIHVLLGIGLIGFVLIQQSKGADAGVAFGNASSGSIFGSQGASSFLSRTSAILATLFFSTSLGLAILGSNQENKIDLMDSPATEELFSDVPLIHDAKSENMLPLVHEDTPKTKATTETTDANNKANHIKEMP